MTFNIFGDFIPINKPPKKTFEQEYSEYINSPAWKRLRDEKIKQVGGNCEKCGVSKWSARLEVHHLTYDRFKHERMEDLKVLCRDCHTGADKQREQEKEDSRDSSPLCIGFENWMDRGNNKRWRSMRTSELAKCWKEFIASINRKTGRKYDVPFNRLDGWH